MLHIKTEARWKNIWRMIGIYNTHPVVWEKYVHIFLTSCIGWIWSRVNVGVSPESIACTKRSFHILCPHINIFQPCPGINAWLASLHTVYCHGGLLCLVWLGFCFAMGEFWAEGSEGTARVTRRWRQRDGRGTVASLRGEVGDEAPLNKQTQHGLRSLSLPYVESLSLSPLSALYLSHVSYNCHWWQWLKSTLHLPPILRWPSAFAFFSHFKSKSHGVFILKNVQLSSKLISKCTFLKGKIPFVGTSNINSRKAPQIFNQEHDLPPYPWSFYHVPKRHQITRDISRITKYLLFQYNFIPANLTP